MRGTEGFQEPRIDIQGSLGQLLPSRASNTSQREQSYTNFFNITLIETTGNPGPWQRLMAVVVLLYAVCCILYAECCMLYAVC